MKFHFVINANFGDAQLDNGEKYMKKIDVSLCASANRPLLQGGFKNWERFVKSLEGNKLNYEVIFVGDVECPYPMPDNFKWIKATVKPAQCYQIAFWEAKGELVGWTADDASYNNPKNNCPNSLDIAYAAYKRIEKEHNNDRKTIIAMNPCEDGGWPQEKWHYLFGGITTSMNSGSKMMAPFGLLDREIFLKDIKGYPNDHVSGQAENSVVMSMYTLGGRVEFCKEATLYVHHRQVHPKNKQGVEVNDFRNWYNEDRKALENRWVKEGYGNYEKYTAEQLKNIVNISDVPLVPIIPFEKTDDVCTVTQGQKGQW